MSPWTPAEVTSLNYMNIVLGVATIGVILAVMIAIARDLIEHRRNG
jgi:hypothetical protein